MSDAVNRDIVSRLKSMCIDYDKTELPDAAEAMPTVLVGDLREAIKEIEQLRARSAPPAEQGEVVQECGNCLARWRCFHCGEVFADEAAAKEHFGPDTEWQAGCIDPLTKDETERRHDQIQMFQELDREREKNSELMNRDYILSRWEADLAKHFNGAKSVHQAMLVLDAMEGRALAAEEKLAALATPPPPSDAPGDAIKPHLHVPDLETMGDCRICGHSRQSPWHTDAPPLSDAESISPSDPRVIIAGIRRFGLAPDGSDLRDLEAALSHPGVRERAGDAEELAGRWPLGCHSPNSCSRNGRCMYVGCKHDGADIRALASSFSSADREAQ